MTKETIQSCDDEAIKSHSFEESLIEVDMTSVAGQILQNGANAIKQIGSKIRVSRETFLYRFAVLSDNEHSPTEKLHIFVDGCGGYTAIIDPNEITAEKTDGHLMDFQFA